ncbi:MAG: hypothetical protein E6Q37_03415 [Crocinitomicaceae bacterium]|nr:MAG: hypothetical protein E6Q37_03415 [Crocinitomicaceae bacterium]
MAVKAISRDGVNQIKKILLLIMRKSVNYKYRMHDPRLGRFFAVDPLYKEFTHNSPYAFSENNDIEVNIGGMLGLMVGVKVDLQFKIDL